MVDCTSKHILLLLQMHHPIQMKPADSENRKVKTRRPTLVSPTYSTNLTAASWPIKSATATPITADTIITNPYVALVVAAAAAQQQQQQQQQQKVQQQQHQQQQQQQLAAAVATLALQQQLAVSNQGKHTKEKNSSKNMILLFSLNTIFPFFLLHPININIHTQKAHFSLIFVYLHDECFVIFFFMANYQKINENQFTSISKDRS